MPIMSLGPVIAVVLAIVMAVVIAVIAWKVSSGEFFTNPQDKNSNDSDQQG